MITSSVRAMTLFLRLLFFFFFNDTATTEIYTLSLHDALPIAPMDWHAAGLIRRCCRSLLADRKSTRLNSSHTVISYAVFCLKKKKKTKQHRLLEKKNKYIITNKENITQK